MPDDGPRVVLTERQAQIYRMVEVEGRPQAEVGRDLGVSRQSINNTLSNVRAVFREAGVENAREAGFEIMAGNRRSTPEVRRFREAAALLGLDASHIAALVARCRDEVPDHDLPVLDERALEALMDRRLHLALRYMDATVMAKSTGSQLAKMAGTLFQMRQLLKGEATSIVRTEDRRTLDQIAQALGEEMARRRMIDVTPGAE